MSEQDGDPDRPNSKALARQERQERLAAELRANLRRRKARGRALDADGPPNTAGAEEGEPPAS